MTDNFDRIKVARAYNEVFNKDPSGIAVLNNLYARFMDHEPSPPLDPLTLAYQAGQRSVVRYIMVQRDRLEREQRSLPTEDTE